MTGRHAGEPASDLNSLGGEWHIGCYWPGMFPHIEQTCPCPKSPCGLVIPDPLIDCADHHGSRPIRQAHHVSDCGKNKRRRRR